MSDFGLLFGPFGASPKYEPPVPLGDRPPLPVLDSPDIWPYYDRWTPHLAKGLTPQRLLSIYLLAEQGWPQQQCDVFEDVIERDAHLRSLLETRRESVAGKEWIIQAGGDQPADIEAAQMLEEALREVDNAGEMIEHQLTAQWYGWAGSEMMWGAASNGTIAPRWFANVPPRRFVFDRWDVPHLLTKEASTLGIPLEPGRWFFSTRPSRVVCRGGLMRTATWYSMFKSMTIRDLVDFLERFGLPLTIGTYPDDFPETEKDALRKATALVGKSGWAVFNERGKIEFAKIDYNGANEMHPGAIGLFNAELSKLITGATLTSGEGTSAGSYALGRVHENVSFNLILADAKRLGDAFAQQVGKPFVRWNGLPARPPRLRINVVREMDPSVRMNSMRAALNDLGLELSADQARAEFQLKPPLSPDDTLKKVAPTQDVPAPRGGPGEVG